MSVKGRLKGDGTFQISGELIEESNNLMVGDDLVNKTIYFSYPANFHEQIVDSYNEFIFGQVEGATNSSSFVVGSNSSVKYILMYRSNPNDTAAYQTTIYRYNIATDTVEVNLTSYNFGTGDTQFGTVTSVESSNPAVQYINKETNFKPQIKNNNFYSGEFIETTKFNIKNNSVEATEFIEGGL